MDQLESLAEVGVPPVPAASEFTAGLRRKLHPRLLAGQVAALAVLAMPWAMAQLLTALAAAVRFTVTGAWPPGRGENAEER